MPRKVTNGKNKNVFRLNKGHRPCAVRTRLAVVHQRRGWSRRSKIAVNAPPGLLNVYRRLVSARRRTTHPAPRYGTIWLNDGRSDRNAHIRRIFVPRTVPFSTAPRNVGAGGTRDAARNKLGRFSLSKLRRGLITFARFIRRARSTVNQSKITAAKLAENYFPAVERDRLHAGGRFDFA